MSASSELRAILKDGREGHFGFDNDIHGEPLLHALPQIVALAEEAEHVANEFVAKYLLQTLEELERALVSWKE